MARCNLKQPERARVLFTGGGGAGSEALARLYADRYEVHFADADPDARPHGVAADRWHTVPMASHSDFMAELLFLCARIGPDLVVPGVDDELLSVAILREASPPLRLLLPPTPFVTAHLDKLASHELLADVVGVPFTETTDQGCYSVAWPCILKPRCGRGSRGVRIVAGVDELEELIPRQTPDWIVQDLLVGQEYTVTVAADATGKLRAIVPCKVALKRGITIRASTHHDSEVIATCKRIHEAYPVPGCYNVQCIKQADGTVKVFEINPRVSTTLCLAVAAGVDPIGIYLGNCPGDELLPFQEGLTLRRSWHNEFAA